MPEKRRTRAVRAPWLSARSRFSDRRRSTALVSGTARRMAAALTLASQARLAPSKDSWSLRSSSLARRCASVSPHAPAAAATTSHWCVASFPTSSIWDRRPSRDTRASLTCFRSSPSRGGAMARADWPGGGPQRRGTSGGRGAARVGRLRGAQRPATMEAGPGLDPENVDGPTRLARKPSRRDVGLLHRFFAGAAPRP